MKIEKAHPTDAAAIASVLQEAAQWLVNGGRPLWSAVDIAPERVALDIANGLFHVAREGEQVAGVMKLELEDAYFWPEIAAGTSAYVHKLAVRRAWAKKGASLKLLSFARTATRELGRGYLRLDCVADRQALRALYERFGFGLHSIVERGGVRFARYELPVANSRPTLRPANRLDAGPACNVLHRSIAGCCAQDHGGDARLIETWLANKTVVNVKSWLEAEANFACVAEQGEHMVGFAMASAQGEVLLCHVVPEVQFTGVGKLLLDALEIEAQARGIGAFRLQSTQTGRSFYLRNGYVPLGAAVTAHGMTAYPLTKTFG